MKLLRIRRTASLLAAALIALSSTACLDISDPPATMVYEGELRATQGATMIVSGGALVLIGQNVTEAGIFLAGEAGVAVSWSVRRGTCDGTGDRITAQSAFPNVTLAGETEEAHAIAVMNWRMEIGTYAAEVFLGTTGAGTRLACADLVRTG